MILSSARVSCECHSRATILAHVAEYHGHDIHRCSHIIGNLVYLPVNYCPLIIPGIKYRFDCHSQLLEGVLRELVAMPLIYPLVCFHQLFESFHIQINILLRTVFLLYLIQLFLKLIVRDSKHNITEHLYEASIGIPGKSLVVRLLRQTLHAFIRESQIEDGIHHSGHAHGSSRTH